MSAERKLTALECNWGHRRPKVLKPESASTCLGCRAVQNAYNWGRKDALAEAVDGKGNAPQGDAEWSSVGKTEFIDP